MSNPFVTTVSLPEYALWERIEDKRTPLCCIHEVTARCNNACRHCYINLPASDAAAKAGELAVDEIIAIADQAAKMGTLWWALTGGEPLLREDFFELYPALHRRGFLISLFTNACLVTQEHIQLFARHRPREIEVTVYGASEATYERVSGRPGSYAAFRHGLELLLQAGLPVNLKAMALRSNLHEFPVIADFCRAHSRAAFRFDPLLHLRYDGDVARNADIRAERLNADEIIALEHSDAMRFAELQQACGKVDEVTCADEPYLLHCAAGMYDFCLDATGKFRLCSSLCHPECVYDLRAGTLAEAWHDYVPTVRARQSHRPEFLQHCRQCRYTELCLWCPAHAALETGELDAWCPDFCHTALQRVQAAQCEDMHEL